MSPRILVVDGHPVQGQLVRSLLKWVGLQVVGLAADGAAALRLAHELYADVVVLSLTRPLVRCFDTARALARAVPPRGVILVAFEDYLVEPAFQAGIRGYVLQQPRGGGIAHGHSHGRQWWPLPRAPPSRRPSSCLAATTRRSDPCPRTTFRRWVRPGPEGPNVLRVPPSNLGFPSRTLGVCGSVQASHLALGDADTSAGPSGLLGARGVCGPVMVTQRTRAVAF